MLAVLAKTDYPFLDIMWTMFIFFAWVIWIWLAWIGSRILVRSSDRRIPA